MVRWSLRGLRSGSKVVVVLAGFGSGQVVLAGLGSESKRGWRLSSFAGWWGRTVTIEMSGFGRESGRKVVDLK